MGRLQEISWNNVFGDHGTYIRDNCGVTKLLKLIVGVEIGLLGNLLD